MKNLRLLLFTISLVAAGAGSLQAGTLYLPRQFQSTELGTVGIALVNPTTTISMATFKLKAIDGAVLSTATRPIAAKGQLSVILDQLFTPATGYVAIELDNNDVSGFWMTGNFLTSTDGAPLLADSAAGPFPCFGLLSPASEISLLNIGTSAATGTLDLRDQTGAIIRSVPFQISASAAMQVTVASLFPDDAANLDTAGYSIFVGGTGATALLLGTITTPNGNGDNLVANATNANYGTLTFPHIVDGQIGGSTYKTQVTINNPKSTAKNLTITLHPASGAALAAQRSIQPFGTFRFGVADLFGISSVDGWLQVTTDSDIVIASAAYSDLTNGGTTAVQAGVDTDTGLIFAHIADLPPWFTGIALVNTATTDAKVEVYAMESSGRQIAGPQQSAAASFTLSAGTKRAFLLNDVISQTQARATDGGYVYIRTTNAVPIFGIELFFLRNGHVYSNVPARLLAGLPFAPPGASTSTPVTVQRVFSGDPNSVPKTSFNAGDPMTLNIAMTNSTGQTINVVGRFRIVGPQSYRLFDFMSVDSLAGNISTYYTDTTIPLTAPAGTYTMTGTVEYNGVQSSATGTFTVSSLGSAIGETIQVLQVFKNKGIPVGSTAGLGTVTSSPSGIACGSSCGTFFATGTQVVLTAVPDATSTFLNWSGDCTPSSNLVMPLAVGAPSPVPSNPPVKPGGGGGGTTSIPTCTTTLTAARSVTANFTKPTVVGESGPSAGGTVGVRVTVSGVGTVTSTPPGLTCTVTDPRRPTGLSCSQSFALGLPVILTATPGAGYHFAGWSGGQSANCPGTDPCTVIASSPSSTGFGDDSTIANFNTNPAPPSPPSLFCDVSCTGTCVQPLINVHSMSCVACVNAYNQCIGQKNSCANSTDFKLLYSFNICSVGFQ